MLPRPIKKLISFTFFVSLFFAVILIILGNIGGNGPSYKNTIEEFATELSGYHAELTQLNNMRFFPYMIFDFDALKFYEDAEADQAVAMIGKGQIAMSFWDVLRQNGRFKYLNIEEIRTRENTILPHAAHIIRFGVEDETGEKARLHAYGTIGEYPVDISWPLLSTAHTATNKTFWFGARRPFNIQLGEADFTGTMAPGQGINIHDFTITLKNQNIIDSADIHIYMNRIVLDKKMNPDQIKALQTYLIEIFGKNLINAVLSFDTEGQFYIFDIPVIFEPSIKNTKNTENPNT